eukprot:8876687-Karenia_brevis.AAC.1
MDPSAGQTVICGDFNWRAQYGEITPHTWIMAEPNVTTTHGTTPTRCITTTYAQQIDCNFITGITYHGLISYAVIIDMDCPAKYVSKRDRKTASYDWKPGNTFAVSDLHDHVQE